MVQLRLESASDEGMPKDCYISVRVGDVQKLSKLSGARTYKFPPNSSKGYGKIEVFRRVGAASIDLNPVVQGLRDVSITCGDTILGLRVGVGGAEPTEADEAKEKAEESQKAKTSATKVKAAKEYLNKHSLEVRLSEAMQTVLRERPDNPVDFLASLLLDGSKKRGAGAAPPLPPPPAAPKQPENLEPSQKQPPAMAAAVAKPSVPFSAWPDYYQQNFKIVPAGGYAQLYSKFPVRKQTQAPEPKKEPKPAATLANFRDYYSEHVPMSMSNFSSIYSRFASHGVAVMKAAKPQAAAQAVAPVSALAVNNARLKPSVGTWHMAKPPAVKTFGPIANFGGKVEAAKAGSPQVAAKTAAPAAFNFRLKPSVGTWLVAAPPAVKTSSPAPARSFATLPSVGSWLSPRPPAASVEPVAAATKPQACAPLALMASAGTWLAPRPPVVRRPRVDMVRQLCGLQSAAAMTTDQRGEVERVLSKALLELTGDLEGEYYPMPSSPSYPARPGGMTADEENLLAKRGLLFKPPTDDASCRGVFANRAFDVAAWVNEASHVRFLVFQAGDEAEARLERFQNAVAAALKQDGYALA